MFTEIVFYFKTRSPLILYIDVLAATPKTSINLPVTFVQGVQPSIMYEGICTVAVGDDGELKATDCTRVFYYIFFQITSL